MHLSDRTVQEKSGTKCEGGSRIRRIRETFGLALLLQRQSAAELKKDGNASEPISSAD